MSTPNAAASDSAGRRTARDAGALGAATTGLGAALITILAGTCCVSPILAPLIVGVLGASGAVWAASLKPYGWWILGMAAIALGAGFWTVYRPRVACEIGDGATRSRFLPRLAKASLWFGTVCWAAALVLRLVLTQ